MRFDQQSVRHGAKTGLSLMPKKSHVQQRAEAEIRLLQEGRGPFVLACEMSKMPIVFTDANHPENRIVYANDSMLNLLGYSAQELLGKSIYSLIAPETDPAHMSKIREGLSKETPIDSEIDCVRKSGDIFRASVFITPVSDVAGRKVQYFGSFVEHKYEEAHWKLVIDELNHRVKNSLAMAQAIVNQALATKADRSTVKTIIETRLSAFSRSHDLLAQQNWVSAGIFDIIRNTLEPFKSADGLQDRIVIHGDNLRFPAKEALALYMVFHELATNALKYGALLSKGGAVHIDWRLEPSESGPRVKLVWRETGGPPVKPPTHQGFGSQMISRGLAYELNGTAHLDYRPDGLVCEMDMPAPALGA